MIKYIYILYRSRSLRQISLFCMICASISKLKLIPNNRIPTCKSPQECSQRHSWWPVWHLDKRNSHEELRRENTYDYSCYLLLSLCLYTYNFFARNTNNVCPNLLNATSARRLWCQGHGTRHRWPPSPRDIGWAFFSRERVEWTVVPRSDLLKTH